MENTLKEIKKIGNCCLYESSKHFNASGRKYSFHLWFSIPVILINLLISSDVFIEIFGERSSTVSFLSLSAAVLVAVSGFMKFQGNSESHQNTGNHFRDLKTEIDIFISKYKDNLLVDVDLGKAVDDFRIRYSAIVDSAQHLRTSGKDYQNSRESITKGEKTHTEEELNL